MFAEVVQYANSILVMNGHIWPPVLALLPNIVVDLKIVKVK